MKPVFSVVAFVSLIWPGLVQYSFGDDDTDPRQKVDVDTAALIDALANHNPAPEFFGKRHNPLFDPAFDWKENSRAWRAIPVLIAQAEAAWPDLVKHLDDDRYCITWKTFSGYTYNKTVGDLCHDIVASNLSQVYFEQVQQIKKQRVHARFGWPDVARDRKMLKIWCEERKSKPLYQLQAEMCQWAIAEIAHEVPDDEVTEGKWTKAKTDIKAELKNLQMTTLAVVYGGFGP